MNKLFYGIVAVALLAIFVSPVFADTIGNQIPPVDVPPEIYLLRSGYDICTPYGIEGGSRPYIPATYFDADGNPVEVQDMQTGGCIDFPPFWTNTRAGQYAFTGEQIEFLVLVRDLNMRDDIASAAFTVGNLPEALCRDVSSGNFYQDEFDDIVPERGLVNAGYQPEYDKIFDCILTVEPGFYGLKKINIEARDKSNVATSNGGIQQGWFFNPAIIMDVSASDGSSSIQYALPAGQTVALPGQTILSKNKLVITNLAEGGVDLWAFIAADDLTDPYHSAARCPDSNVLDVDQYMDYRCKIGTLEDDEFHCITNKDTSQGCHYNGCLGARPLLADNYPVSIIGNMKDAECEFKLTIPNECTGTFTQGKIHVLVRAV